MEDSWENWISSLEMGDDNFLSQCHMKSDDEEKFLKEIMLLSQDHSLNPSETSKYNTDTEIVNDSGNGATTAAAAVDSCLANKEAGLERNGTMPRSNSSNSIVSQDGTTVILSLENSIGEPLLHKTSSKQFDGDGGDGGGNGGRSGTLSSPLGSKMRMNNNDSNIEDEPNANNEGSKKVRNSTETKYHIMAERKRRQEMTERFIALSATIPGLKKIDKAHVLREAINYVKQLQERVKELENQNKRKRADSVIFIKKSPSNTNYEEITPCEFNSLSHYKSNKALPQIEVRVLGKEVLIGIHCEKQKDIVLKIMASLENLHLSLASSSVLPFGNSTLKVTIIAQMGDKYCMTVNDVVENLRQDLFKSDGIQQ